MQITVRYALFAALSMAANLGAQGVVLALLGPMTSALALAVAVGTVAGFALKYWLDKRWIFNAPSVGIRLEARQIVLYGLFSVATTAVFWATEAGFALLWRSALASYVGGAIGLCLGYALKYVLDGRYTFGKPA
ncbi:MAG: GtrA family protein [Caulobacteraceae bacterium]|nr:GtrA family protein [Caulobacteraceae bacterium]